MRRSQYTNEPHENNPQLVDFFSENYLVDINQIDKENTT